MLQAKVLEENIGGKLRKWSIIEMLRGQGEHSGSKMEKGFLRGKQTESNLKDLKNDVEV